MAELAKISNVDIDSSDDAEFKYILIEATEGDKHKLMVRGYKSCEWHVDIFERVKAEESADGKVSFKCVGGGRIVIKSNERKMVVFGNSSAFGKADHQASAQLLKKHFTNFGVEFSNE